MRNSSLAPFTSFHFSLNEKYVMLTFSPFFIIFIYAFGSEKPYEDMNRYNQNSIHRKKEPKKREKNLLILIIYDLDAHSFPFVYLME